MSLLEKLQILLAAIYYTTLHIYHSPIPSRFKNLSWACQHPISVKKRVVVKEAERENHAMFTSPPLGTRNEKWLKQEQERYWAPMCRQTHTHTHTHDSGEGYVVLLWNLCSSDLAARSMDWIFTFSVGHLEIRCSYNFLVLNISPASERKVMSLKLTPQLIHPLQKWRGGDFALPNRERTHRDRAPCSW